MRERKTNFRALNRRPVVRRDKTSVWRQQKCILFLQHLSQHLSDTGHIWTHGLEFTHGEQTAGLDQMIFYLFHFLRRSSSIPVCLKALCSSADKQPFLPFCPLLTPSCTMNTVWHRDSCGCCRSASLNSSHQAPAALLLPWHLHILEHLSREI